MVKVNRWEATPSIELTTVQQNELPAFFQHRLSDHTAGNLYAHHATTTTTCTYLGAFLSARCGRDIVV